jgi:nidogen (entactin)
MPVSIIGKIQGTLNSEPLSDLDLYGYVITQVSDSRNFVVIRKIPPHLAGSFQTLLSIASPISWLFSGLTSQHHRPISNGFALTGGLFTRMVTLNFYDESLRHSHTLMIRQEYLGLDTNTNELSVRTVIDGNVPSIDPDAQVVFKDYSQKYERLSKGFIASKGEADYEITSAQNSQTFTSYRLQYSDEIQFNECPFLDTSAVSDVRLNSKRVFIQYTKGDGLVRFSSANFIYPADADDDPCETNACSVYAECIADYEARGNYSCMCKVGFEGDGFNCHDIDECQIGENDCDVNAECYNLVGHYECSCLSPYVGSGKECKYGEVECQGCDVNAVCVDKRCECRSGYSGDGLTCKPERECEVSCF